MATTGEGVDSYSEEIYNDLYMATTLPDVFTIHVIPSELSEKLDLIKQLGDRPAILAVLDDSVSLCCDLMADKAGSSSRPLSESGNPSRRELVRFHLKYIRKSGVDKDSVYLEIGQLGPGGPGRLCMAAVMRDEGWKIQKRLRELLSSSRGKSASKPVASTDVGGGSCSAQMNPSTPPAYSNRPLPLPNVPSISINSEMVLGGSKPSKLPADFLTGDDVYSFIDDCSDAEYDDPRSLLSGGPKNQTGTGFPPNQGAPVLGEDSQALIELYPPKNPKKPNLKEASKDWRTSEDDCGFSPGAPESPSAEEESIYAIHPRSNTGPTMGTANDRGRIESNSRMLPAVPSKPPRRSATSPVRPTASNPKGCSGDGDMGPRTAGTGKARPWASVGDLQDDDDAGAARATTPASGAGGYAEDLFVTPYSTIPVGKVGGTAATPDDGTQQRRDAGCRHVEDGSLPSVELPPARVESNALYGVPVDGNHFVGSGIPVLKGTNKQDASFAEDQDSGEGGGGLETYSNISSMHEEMSQLRKPRTLGVHSASATVGSRGILNQLSSRIRGLWTSRTNLAAEASSSNRLHPNKSPQIRNSSPVSASPGGALWKGKKPCTGRDRQPGGPLSRMASAEAAIPDVVPRPAAAADIYAQVNVNKKAPPTRIQTPAVAPKKVQNQGGEQQKCPQMRVFREDPNPQRQGSKQAAAPQGKFRKINPNSDHQAAGAATENYAPNNLYGIGEVPSSSSTEETDRNKLTQKRTLVAKRVAKIEAEDVD